MTERLALALIPSRFLPRFLGVWLIVNGFAYLAMSFTGLLLPRYEDVVSNVAFPALLGEMAFMLWLVIKGVNLPKWEERGSCENVAPQNGDL